MLNSTRLAIFFLIIVPLATACTSGGAPTPQTGTAATDDILKGGEITMVSIDPTTLDPALVSDTVSAGLAGEIFSGLVRIDRNLNIVPDIAEEWVISNGGLTYTFTLRNDVKFHDGKPVRAQDFKYSMERALDPGTESPIVDIYLGDIIGAKDKLTGIAREVRGIQVLDDFILEITIDAPKAYFLAKLAYPTAFVLDRENVESGDNWVLRPNGTGPFKLAEWRVGEKIRLERNELFYDDPPHLDAVDFILSGGNPLVMYENGEIDLTRVGRADIDRVLDPNDLLNSELHSAPGEFATSYIAFNTGEEPFNDVRVRQALSYAVNKELIAESVLSNLVRPAYGILPPGFPGYNEDLEGIHFDLEAAMRLMAESSYGQADPQVTRLLIEADEEANLNRRMELLKEASSRAAASLPTVEFLFAGGGGAVGPDIEAILEMWRTFLGVNVEIQQSEFANFFRILDRGDFQMAGLAWIADYPDPQAFLDILFYSGSPNNYTNYHDVEADRLLEQARTELEVDSRISLYQQAEQIIVDDAALIPLWFQSDKYILIKPHVRGYTLTPIIIPKLKNVYIQEE